jgi:rfaE bifunctional protein kinase chain/domain
VAGIPQPRLRRDQGELKTPAIFDGRNLYDPASLKRLGFEYFPIGRRTHRQTLEGTVLVVGDVMLDRYWFGEVSRISPEAPVPVVLIGREEQRLGGAANVAWNCKALGAHTRLLSVVGRDEPGGQLEKLIKKQASRRACTATPSSTRRRSFRVIGRKQQLLRIDFEKPPSREVLAAKLEEFKSALADCDVVILSDYGKGGLTHITEMVRAARKAGQARARRPKGDDYSRYKGVSVITPNLDELRRVIGTWKDEKDLKGRAQAMREKLGLEALLLTRGEHGMTLFAKSKTTTIPAVAREAEVFDVTGAGDTVIATLAVMLAAGAGMEAAMRIANRAAGIVVGKLGTAVATHAELFGGMRRRAQDRPKTGEKD